MVVTCELNVEIQKCYRKKPRIVRCIVTSLIFVQICIPDVSLRVGLAEFSTVSSLCDGRSGFRLLVGSGHLFRLRNVWTGSGGHSAVYSVFFKLGRAQWRTEGRFGWFKPPLPPEFPNALQNRAKLNPIVETVKNC